jgi:hypothetical protein
MSLALLLMLAPAAALDADLKPPTTAAFDRYVAAAERRMDAELKRADPFLWIDTLAPARRQQLTERLRRGEVVTERLRLAEKIDVPDGLVHHCVGTVFIPGVRVGAVVALMQDYDRHATVFRPNVVQSKTLARDGDRFRLFLRFYMKKVIGATLDTEHEARFVTVAPDRVYSTIRSTRVAEVEDAGTPSEHELPPGKGHGFMWRLNTYWRFLERDGGAYVQCESLTLSRDVPFGLGWIVKPFITDVPMESLAFTLQRIKAAVR